MSNTQNLIIADHIMELVQTIPFVRPLDRLDYANKWYQNALMTDSKDLSDSKPTLYYPKAMTDDELFNAENSFINSFSE